MNIFKKIARYKERVKLIKKHGWINHDIKYFYNNLYDFYISKNDIWSMSDKHFEHVCHFLRY